MAKQEMPNGNNLAKQDDKHLSELFHKGLSNHCLNPKDLSSKAVHKAHKKFLPKHNFKSFSQLNQQKARAVSLGQVLSGARKDSKGSHNILMLLFVA